MQMLDTFAYIGRNRRSEECVVEKLVEFTSDELKAISEKCGSYREQLEPALHPQGIPLDGVTLPKHRIADDAADFFTSLYGAIVPAILRTIGHRQAIIDAAAGYFDHYVCRAHFFYTGPDEQKVLALIKEDLLESGVEEHQIITTTNQSFAVETTLKKGGEGDLLALAPGSKQKPDTREQIISFESG